MRRSQSLHETSVGLFAFLDVLMSTMGSLILVLMIVTPKIRQEKVARAATEAARDVVKVESAPAPPPPPPPVVSPPRETIDLNAKFATRVAELSTRADDKRRAATDAQRALSAERERSQHVHADRDKLEHELAELRAAKDHTLASVDDLSAEGLKVESELAKRGSRLRKIRDQIAHTSTEYAFVAYDGVSGTTRRPIVIECVDDEIKFQQENITLTAADIAGFSPASNPLLAGAETLLKYWSTHSAPNDPKPYVLIVVRPSGTLAYYRARHLLERMKAPFGYELLPEDQKLAVPSPQPDAVVACRDAVAQAIAKRESVFDQPLGIASGLNPRNRWHLGGGGPRDDLFGGAGNATSGKPGSPFDDPFDLAGGDSKGAGKGPGGDSLVASGDTTSSSAIPGAFRAGSAGLGGGPSGAGTGGAVPSGGGAGGIGLGGGVAVGGFPGGGASGGGVPGSGSPGGGSPGAGLGGDGSAGVGVGAGGAASGPGGALPGGGTAGGVGPDGTAGAAAGSNNLTGLNGGGNSQNGSDPNGGGTGKPGGSLAGLPGPPMLARGNTGTGADGSSGGPRSESGIELLPPPGSGSGSGSNAGAFGASGTAASTGDLAQTGIGQAAPDQAAQGQAGQPQSGDLASAFGSFPSTPILQAGSGGPQSGSGGGAGDGGSGQQQFSPIGGGEPGASPGGSDAGSAGAPGDSGMPGGSPSGSSPTSDTGGQPGQTSIGSVDEPGASPMPSFSQSSDDAPPRPGATRRWGYSSPQASIGFEHDVTVWMGARAIVVGGQPPIRITRAESGQRLAALVVPALEREARTWGRPPDHLYWVPSIKFVVSPGGNLPYERLRPVMERHNLVSSVEYRLELESPRQTFQSWVQ